MFREEVCGRDVGFKKLVHMYAVMYYLIDWDRGGTKAAPDKNVECFKTDLTAANLIP